LSIVELAVIKHFCKECAMEEPKKNKREFLSIYWKCCSVYSRIYKRPDKGVYEGFCPRCRAPLSVPIGEGGTKQRSFIAE
jgi:hypothetical protein